MIVDHNPAGARWIKQVIRRFAVVVQSQFSLQQESMQHGVGVNYITFFRYDSFLFIYLELRIGVGAIAENGLTYYSV